MYELISINSEMVSVINFIFAFLLILLGIFLWVKMNKMRNKYMKMLGGVNSSNVEDLIIKLQNQTKQLVEENQSQKATIMEIQTAMKSMKSRVGIHRYNAFSEYGNAMSFSLAILDENQNGVVLSGIHNREDTYIYAKPIKNGESEYVLSPEEKEAIIRSS